MYWDTLKSNKRKITASSKDAGHLPEQTVLNLISKEIAQLHEISRQPLFR